MGDCQLQHPDSVSPYVPLFYLSISCLNIKLVDWQRSFFVVVFWCFFLSFFLLICNSECLFILNRVPGHPETGGYSTGPSERLLHSFPAARVKTPASNIENHG